MLMMTTTNPTTADAARIVDAFDRCELSPNQRRALTLEAFVLRLREAPVLAAMGGVLRAAGAPESVNARVCLAAFLIVDRPTHVFEAMGPLEDALLACAEALLRTFEALLDALRAGAAAPEAFSPQLRAYLDAFKAWKVTDEAKLVRRIKHALNALYHAEELLPYAHTENNTEHLADEFRSQIEQLRAKLQRIDGPDALARFDAARHAPPSVA